MPSCPQKAAQTMPHKWCGCVPVELHYRNRCQSVSHVLLTCFGLKFGKCTSCRSCLPGGRQLSKPRGIQGAENSDSCGCAESGALLCLWTGSSIQVDSLSAEVDSWLLQTDTSHQADRSQQRGGWPPAVQAEASKHPKVKKGRKSGI